MLPIEAIPRGPGPAQWASWQAAASRKPGSYLPVAIVARIEDGGKRLELNRARNDADPFAGLAAAKLAAGRPQKGQKSSPGRVETSGDGWSVTGQVHKGGPVRGCRDPGATIKPAPRLESRAGINRGSRAADAKPRRLLKSNMWPSRRRASAGQDSGRVCPDQRQRLRKDRLKASSPGAKLRGSTSRNDVFILEGDPRLPAAERNPVLEADRPLKDFVCHTASKGVFCFAVGASGKNR